MRVKRRHFLTATGAALAVPAAADPTGNAWYQLHFFFLRNGPQVERTTAYLKDVWLPATRRNGIGPVGFFSPVIGERAPFILSLASVPSWTALETAHSKLAADKEFLKGRDEYDDPANPPYVRMESGLLRAFDGMPALETPPTEGQPAARIFEMRSYESPNEKAGARKIKMFNDAEMGIFRRLGMRPVFFGQAVTGSDLPKLTYMLAFDNLAARERLWAEFGADPEWRKLRAQPGLSDAEIVSNISNAILRPLPFSPIR